MSSYRQDGQRPDRVAELAIRFTVGQHIRLISNVNLYDAGATGVILHQESSISFSVRLDNQSTYIQPAVLYADEIEAVYE